MRLTKVKNCWPSKKYDAAAKKFGKAADRWPDSAMEEDSMFLQAESYFFADRYSKADDEYGELLKKYPNTRYLNKSTARQFSIARYWQDMDKAHPHWPLTPNLVDKTRPLFDTGGHAINAYDNVRVNDPRGPLADARDHGRGQHVLRKAVATRTPTTTTASCAAIIPRARISCRRICWGCNANCGSIRGRTTTASRWKKPTS